MLWRLIVQCAQMVCLLHPFVAPYAKLKPTGGKKKREAHQVDSCSMAAAAGAGKEVFYLQF